jgi:predicted nucleic acid-binding protein
MGMDIQTVYVPQSILDKEATLEDLKNCLDQFEYGTIATTTVDSLIFLKEISEKRPGLSEFDAECIAIARENMIYCTSNEKRVLNTCVEYGIDCTGTVGILSCAYEHGILETSEFERLMKKLFSTECSAHLGLNLKKIVFEHYDITA